MTDDWSARPDDPEGHRYKVTPKHRTKGLKLKPKKSSQGAHSGLMICPLRSKIQKVTLGSARQRQRELAIECYSTTSKTNACPRQYHRANPPRPPL